MTSIPACKRCSYIGCDSARARHPLMGHWIWIIQLSIRNFKKSVTDFIESLSDFDYSKIDEIEIEGIDHGDYPDFCDAFISYATYKGRPMTDAQLDRLNDNSSFVYDQVFERLN